jgi:hypothetical protein
MVIGRTGLHNPGRPVRGVNRIVINIHCRGVFRRVRKTAKSSNLLRHVCPSVSLSACNNSAPTGRILLKFGIWAFLEAPWRKFEFHYNPTKITGTLHEDVFKFMIISRWIILRMRNVLDKSCRENQNTHFMFSNFSPRKLCRLWECPKIWWSRRGRIWQYGACAWRPGEVRLHARTHTPAPVHQHRNTHAKHALIPPPPHTQTNM